jgi:hypothetical protein
VSKSSERQRALVWWVKQWIGFSEEGGPNKGQAVERFQRAVDGKAEGEPWCLAFCFFCLKATDDLFDAMALASLPGHRLYPTEHVLTAWGRSPLEARSDAPEAGALAVWQHVKDGQPTSSGHAGIVVDVLSNGTFRTVEGNTSKPGGDQREGDGVYLKERTMGGLPGLRLLGFLKPWPQEGK